MQPSQMPRRSLVLLMLTICSCAAMSAGRVAVAIRTRLAVPPGEARAAWLDYVWSRGGGLPLGTLLTDDAQERTLLPLLLRERLVPTTTDVEVPKLAYTVTDAGPVLGVDVVAGSHTGTVSFTPSDEDCTEMLWDVEFDCSGRTPLWEAVTQNSVGEVSANLEAFTAKPEVFSLTARLPSRPGDALDTWLQCLADGDLGVPMPPPIVTAQGDASWQGYERLVLPPGLRERVTCVERGDGPDAAARCEYQVVNPGWLRCYPVHSHLGAVDFAPSADGASTTMSWTVSVRPQRLARPVVRALTNAIVPAFARNLAGRLGDADGAAVKYSWS